MAVVVVEEDLQRHQFSGFSFLHKSISRSDPLYFDPGAVQARIDEWTKLLEFHCFEENHLGEVNVYEKADLLAQGCTVVRPVMVTSIKNFGTFDAMFKARLAADGRTVERDMSLFGPPMDLLMKRCIDFISRNTAFKSRKRRKMFLSDLKNGYLHAYLSDENPIYMENMYI